ncbi:MAG: response regulator [Epsilonproteobacteria bacterium]|nr:response regulator [Campylobacterota bacterium]
MIKIFLIDASIKNRTLIKQYLAFEKDIKVIGEANDPIDAMKVFSAVGLPDVFLVSAHLEKISIFDFLKKLKEQRPIPTIVYADIADKLMVQRLYDAGATKVIPQPIESDTNYRYALLTAIRAIKIKTLNIKPINKIIAIGSSTGGVQALEEIIKRLKKNHAPIIITQHMPSDFTGSFAKRLTSLYKNTYVKEAEDFDELAVGRVLLAPGNKHMEVIKKGNGYQVILKDYPKVNGHKPSIDVMFDSVAREVGDKAVAFLLTGMGKDGALGLKKIREAGGITYAQDEQSSIVYGMPKVANEIGAARYVVPLKDIANIINAY